MKKSHQISRRNFMGTTAMAAAAGPMVVKSTVFGANDRITFAGIGMGGQGRGDLGGFLGFKELQVLA
ncbi:MAG: twin-arginine translocation signal domain-containing protein, partial [Verrucomicrobiota bacterium]